jgi:type I restriction enzyme M protein
MSSQASSAGHGEKTVRKAIIETGDVDVMISIRSNFFYTRTVPCELWFFDRAKPAERCDKVLMLDARNIHRKVTRKIYDFSPEQLRNLSAIVWLYRGQRDRFLALVKDYLRHVCMESDAIPSVLAAYEATLTDLRARFDRLANTVAKYCEIDLKKKEPLASAVRELGEAASLYETDREQLLNSLGAFRKTYADALPYDNDTQQTARSAFDPIAQAIRGLIKKVDLLYKLTARITDLGSELSAFGAVSGTYDRRAAAKLLKQLEERRKMTVEQLRQAAYFHRQQYGCKTASQKLSYRRCQGS